jgi:hypothetical protein
MTSDHEPEDGPEIQGPYRLLDGRFWAALAFLVLCVASALVVAFQGPKLWPRRTPSPHAPASKHLPLKPDPR